MENRINVRVAKKLSVELSFVGIDCGKFTALNIGYGGLFLDECSNVLDVGDFVVVSFQEESAIKTTTISLRALVVHCSQEGAGLMWADSIDETYELLNDIVSIAA